MAFALQVQAAAPATPADADVVVLARRMRTIQVDLKTPKREGRYVLQRCRISKSSGDAEIDAIPCRAAASCVADPIAERRLLDTCVVDRSRPMFDAVVAARRARETRP